jgi:hypothetical protein
MNRAAGQKPAGHVTMSRKWSPSAWGVAACGQTDLGGGGRLT